MASINDIKADLNELTTMKFVTQAFTEASATKLKNIRSSFEKNRQFYEQIRHIYHLVRVNANRMKIKDVDKTIPPSKIKTLTVAMTSNKHFYGSLNTMIMNAFLADTKNSDSDLMVVGNTGLEYIKSFPQINKYQKLVFLDDNPNQKESTQFLNDTGKYNKVIIYYPKYVTLLSQNVGIIDITHTESFDEKESEEEFHILFEPEFAKILDFFERQVRVTLFMRMLFETDIARTSARLISMSTAEDRADTLLKVKKVEYRKATNTAINTKLLETFNSLFSKRKNI